MNWVRNDRLRDNGLDSATVRRTYIPEGRLFPRLTLSIHKHDRPRYDAGGLLISCSEKVAQRSWWQDRPCPLELVDDLVEMLQEVVE